VANKTQLHVKQRDSLSFTLEITMTQNSMDKAKERELFLIQLRGAEDRVKDSMKLCSKVTRFNRETKELRRKADRITKHWAGKNPTNGDIEVKQGTTENAESSSPHSSNGHTSRLRTPSPAAVRAHSSLEHRWSITGTRTGTAVPLKRARTPVLASVALGQRVATPSRSIRESQPSSRQAEFSRMENRDPKDPSMHMVLKREWDELATGDWRSPCPSIFKRLQVDASFNDQFGLGAQLHRWQKEEKHEQLQYEQGLHEQSKQLITHAPELPHLPSTGSRANEKAKENQDKVAAAADWIDEGKRRGASRGSSRTQSRGGSRMPSRPNTGMAMCQDPSELLHSLALYEEGDSAIEEPPPMQSPKLFR